MRGEELLDSTRLAPCETTSPGRRAFDGGGRGSVSTASPIHDVAHPNGPNPSSRALRIGPRAKVSWLLTAKPHGHPAPAPLSSTKAPAPKGLGIVPRPPASTPSSTPRPVPRPGDSAREHSGLDPGPPRVLRRRVAQESAADHRGVGFASSIAPPNPVGDARADASPGDNQTSLPHVAGDRAARHPPGTRLGRGSLGSDGPAAGGEARSPPPSRSAPGPSPRDVDILRCTFRRDALIPRAPMATLLDRRMLRSAGSCKDRSCTGRARTRREGCGDGRERYWLGEPLPTLGSPRPHTVESGCEALGLEFGVERAGRVTGDATRAKGPQEALLRGPISTPGWFKGKAGGAVRAAALRALAEVRDVSPGGNNPPGKLSSHELLQGECSPRSAAGPSVKIGGMEGKEPRSPAGRLFPVRAPRALHGRPYPTKGRGGGLTVEALRKTGVVLDRSGQVQVVEKVRCHLESPSRGGPIHKKESMDRKSISRRASELAWG